MFDVIVCGSATVDVHAESKSDLIKFQTPEYEESLIALPSGSKVLIEELNISAALDPDILDKIEQNGDDKDALIKIITNSFYSTYNYLQKNERGGVSSIIMAGSWIEGVFIATHISEDTFNNKEMVKIILDQKNSLDKLVDLLTKNADDPDVQSVYDAIYPLKQIYDSIDENAITEDQLNSIKDTVRDLRDKIIE